MRKLAISIASGAIALTLYFIVFGDFSPAVWIAFPFAVLFGIILECVIPKKSPDLAHAKENDLKTLHN